MRYNSMPRGEFFFVVDSTVSRYLGPAHRMMIINAPELDFSETPLFIYMASEVKEKSYKALHKALRKELRKSSK
jgi:hypothetical protein